MLEILKHKMMVLSTNILEALEFWMCSENSRNVASQERNFLGLREISIGGTSPQPRRMVAYLLYLMSSGVFLVGVFI